MSEQDSARPAVSLNPLEGDPTEADSWTAQPRTDIVVIAQ